MAYISRFLGSAHCVDRGATQWLPRVSLYAAPDRRADKQQDADDREPQQTVDNEPENDEEQPNDKQSRDDGDHVLIIASELARVRLTWGSDWRLTRRHSDPQAI
jgi:hypothetical protein